MAGSERVPLVPVHTRIQGLNYDYVESKVTDEYLGSLSERDEKRVFLLSWGMTVVIAVSTGILAFGVSKAIHGLHEGKMKVAEDRLEAGDTTGATFTFLGMSVLFVLLGGLIVALVELKAKGSGVPEIKSYLNGLKIPRVIALKTLASKVLGIIFSVAGGLVVGKEGPMIHSGAILGAVISQGRAEYISGWKVQQRVFQAFRNDRWKRDFVSVGCACGVAGAFGSPIGGVLFVLEEAATFWSTRLTWMTFFATMLTVLLTVSLIAGEVTISQSPVVSFGSFEGASKDPAYPAEPTFTLYEIPVFVLMGVAGGLAGAVFNQINKHITVARRKYVTTAIRRIAETIVIAAVTSTVVWLASNWGTCEKEPTGVNLELKRFGCPEGEVSVAATLYFNGLDETVKQLFHSTHTFAQGTLLGHFALMFILSDVTYGICIPSGMFVPAILMGAAPGRALGELLRQHAASWYGDARGIDAGTYALIGGAAMLGGITRMTISIVVIVLECTNNITYAVPIMLSIMAAKLTGDYFTPGLYDIHIDLQGLNFLEEQPELDMRRLRVCEIMSQPVITLPEEISLRELVDFLASNHHAGFPVVRYSEGHFAPMSPTTQSRPKKMMSFQGFLLRSQLSVIAYEALQNQKLTLVHEDFLQHYPTFPTAEELCRLLQASPSSTGGELIDVTPYMNLSHCTVHHSTHVGRVHRLFRSMGLRHLTVVNSLNLVVGVVSRADVIRHFHPHHPRRGAREMEAAAEKLEESLHEEEDEEYRDLYQGFRRQDSWGWKPRSRAAERNPTSRGSVNPADGP